MTDYLRGTICSDGKKFVIADCQTDGATFFLTFPYLTRIDNAIIKSENVTGSGHRYVIDMSPLSNQILATTGATVLKFKAFTAVGALDDSALDISGRFLTVWAFGE